MIFTLLVFLLIINLILLYFGVFSLKTSLFANNGIFIANIIAFFIYIQARKKHYNMNSSSYSFAMIFPFVLILFYYFVRKVKLVSKPFSDLFGYIFINNEINKLLNSIEKPHTIFKNFTYNVVTPIKNIFNLKDSSILTYLTIPFRLLYEIPATIIRIVFFPFFLCSQNKEIYLETNDENYYENNWNKFVNSIPFESNGIDHLPSINKSNHILELRTNANLYGKDTTLQYGGNNISFIDKLLHILLDFPTLKDKSTIIKILDKAEKKINIDKFINLLDKKYMVSKIIWLIIIVIFTRSIYSVLIISTD